MSLIKKIKQFINGSWQEFQLDANNIDNVATREWVTNADKTIVGDTTFNGDILFDGGEIKLTNEVILSGSEIYYDGQYVGDFHPNAPYAYANRQWVESLVTNQVKYLGIVNSVNDITNAFYSSDSALGKAGDFVRAGSSFTIETETVHPGDIIIANNVSLDISLANYDIIHTEDPGNYATLNTDQTITGKKTFDAESTFNSFVFIKNYDGSLTTSLDGMSLVLPKANGDNLVISASSIMIDDTASSRKNGETPKFPTMNFATVTGTLLVDTNLTNGSLSEIVLDVDNMKTWTSTINGYGIEVKNPISVARYGGEDIALSLNGATYQFNFPIFSLPEGTTYGVNTISTQEWVKANTICSSTIDQEFFNSLY